MSEFIERIQKKATIMKTLKGYRPAMMRLFQDVVQVSTEVQPETNTKVVNFTNEVINDLPPRMRAFVMLDFEAWLDRNGRDFLGDSGLDLKDVELHLEVTRIKDAIEIVVFDAATSYQVTETVAYADLAPFLQAGLDFHAHAYTFFIPRS